MAMLLQLDYARNAHNRWNELNRVAQWEPNQHGPWSAALGKPN